jgi:hypothetical protein
LSEVQVSGHMVPSVAANVTVIIGARVHVQ